MDAFCEYLVKKKSTSDKLKRLGLALACAVVCLLICYLAFFHFHQIIVATPILVAAVIYGTVLYSRNFSLEYEYIFTNGVLDVDVIKGRISRKHLTSVSCRKIEHMRPMPRTFRPNNTVIDAIYDEKRSGKYVVTFSNKGKRYDLLFQPPEKLLQNMKQYNPRNIEL